MLLHIGLLNFKPTIKWYLWILKLHKKWQHENSLYILFNLSIYCLHCKKQTPNIQKQDLSAERKNLKLLS